MHQPGVMEGIDGGVGQPRQPFALGRLGAEQRVQRLGLFHQAFGIAGFVLF